MLTNLIRAKVSTHAIAVALGVLIYFMNQFLSDPHADAWLRAHWIVKDMYTYGVSALTAYGLYATPTKRSA